MLFMRFILLFLMTLSMAYGQTVDELWSTLKDEFESREEFFNFSINRHRDNVMSPFMNTLFKDLAMNNARPLTNQQIQSLPDAEFVSREIFHLAMKGRERLLKAKQIKNHPLVVIADFSQSSRNRRLYIIDLVKKKTLINTWVSHAYNSDEDHDGYADKFGNISGSELSSLGFMTTAETYYGQWGYSLRIKGLDPKLNSKVYSRAVVFHGDGSMGAHQASWGRSSSSLGCPMISMSESGKFWGMEDNPLHQIVIDTIKSGAMVFFYSDIEEQGLRTVFQSNWIKESDLPDEVTTPEAPEITYPQDEIIEQGEGEPPIIKIQHVRSEF